jgi:tRNA(fMet)-specific endonuclease VapC
VRIALDTNRYCDLCRGDNTVRDLIETAEQVFVPFVVIAELRAGFSLGLRSAENERVLVRFLGKDGVLSLFADEDTTHHYAALFRQLRSQGTPIPTHDIWIAALALQHGLLLCSRDQHFDRVPQLRRC